MFDVITIGSATLDVFIRSKGLGVEKTDGTRDICVRYGAKIPVDELSFASGGGGTNTAVTFARQGLKVASIVKVADDFSGKRVIEDLAKEGVETKFVVEERGGQTDYSTILYVPDGDRTILVYRGETKLEVEEIPWEKLTTNWLYISSVEGNLKIVENCQSKIINCQIAWNPGAGELVQKEKVLGLLPKITLLNLNKEEMAELLGIPGQDLGQLLEKAHQLPCQYVVMTDDKRGSYLYQQGEDFWWHCGIFEEVPRRETTGAGDSFGSGLVTGLIKGFSLKDCLKLASANASSVVSQIGAKKGLLRGETVGDWLGRQIALDRINL